MENRCDKEVDNGSSARKAKRVENGNQHAVIPLVLPENPIIKRRKLNRCFAMSPDSVANFGKSLKRNYSNFVKSDLPDRLLFYKDDKWTDFPQDIVSLARGNFQMKKTSFEVEYDGHCHLLDFLNMVQLNVETGLYRSIAWIDGGGGCFFPEVYCSDYECVDSMEEEETGFNEPREINLHLEIDLNQEDGVKLVESSGESNMVKPIQTDGGCGSERVSVVKEASLSSDSESRDSHLETVRSALLELLGSSQAPEYVAIGDTSGRYSRDRLEQFRKQVEMTGRLRGDANLRYAWLPCMKEHSFSNVIFELGVGVMLNNRSACGTGLRLIASNCTGISASLFDIDENGSCHVVLCRVVLGNMEVVPRGSGRSCPSSTKFDTGVDSLENPRYYTVWPINVNTHIYPEYIISFRVPSWDRGSDSSGVTTEASQQPGFSPAILGKDSPSTPESGMKAPKSSWLPFPVLFSVIACKVNPRDMKLINFHYQLLKSKKINRMEFVGQLRLIIGDDVLKSAIISLQDKFSAGQVKREDVP